MDTLAYMGVACLGSGIAIILLVGYEAYTQRQQNRCTHYRTFWCNGSWWCADCRRDLGGYL